MLDSQYRITSRKILKYYLECDRVSLGIKKANPSLIPYVDIIWKFQILLRTTEYWSNQKSLISKLIFSFYRFFYKRQSLKVGVEIPLNCIREGLRIWHLNRIIINPEAIIGKNLSISSGVIIGHSNAKIPILGDGIVLTVDAKILGANIVNNVVIGAGAVVIRDIDEVFSTWAGVPAKKISNDYPELHVKRIAEVNSVELS